MKQKICPYANSMCRIERTEQRQKEFCLDKYMNCASYVHYHIQEEAVRKGQRRKE